MPAGEDMEQEVRELNAGFERKGLYLTVLRRRGERATVYLCRVSQLASELAKPEVAQFLRGCGYGSLALPDALEQLRRRFAETRSIPHEIGVFLGYPLGDVLASSPTADATACARATGRSIAMRPRRRRSSPATASATRCIPGSSAPDTV